MPPWRRRSRRHERAAWRRGERARRGRGGRREHARRGWPARCGERARGRGGLRVTRVVVLGEVMLDVVAFHDAPLAIASDTPARISMRPGGAGANTAAWLARAGADVTLVASVGDDEAAKVALSGLDGVDLRVAVDKGSRTGTCIVLVAPGGERTMLPDPGANTALSIAGAGSDFVEGNILHVSGYSLMRPGSRGAALEAMDLARDAGMLVSVDPASAALLIDDPA